MASLLCTAILLFLLVNSSGLFLVSSIETGDEDDEGEVSIRDGVNYTILWSLEKLVIRVYMNLTDFFR